MAGQHEALRPTPPRSTPGARGRNNLSPSNANADGDSESFLLASPATGGRFWGSAQIGWSGNAKVDEQGQSIHKRGGRTIRHQPNSQPSARSDPEREPLYESASPPPPSLKSPGFKPSLLSNQVSRSLGRPMSSFDLLERPMRQQISPRSLRNGDSAQRTRLRSKSSTSPGFRADENAPEQGNQRQTAGAEPPSKSSTDSSKEDVENDGADLGMASLGLDTTKRDALTGRDSGLSKRRANHRRSASHSVLPLGGASAMEDFSALGLASRPQQVESPFRPQESASAGLFAPSGPPRELSTQTYQMTQAHARRPPRRRNTDNLPAVSPESPRSGRRISPRSSNQRLLNPAAGQGHSKPGTRDDGKGPSVFSPSRARQGMAAKNFSSTNDILEERAAQYSVGGTTDLKELRRCASALSPNMGGKSSTSESFAKSRQERLNPLGADARAADGALDNFDGVVDVEGVEEYDDAQSEDWDKATPEREVGEQHPSEYRSARQEGPAFRRPNLRVAVPPSAEWVHNKPVPAVPDAPRAYEDEDRAEGTKPRLNAHLSSSPPASARPHPPMISRLRSYSSSSRPDSIFESEQKLHSSRDSISDESSGAISTLSTASTSPTVSPASSPTAAGTAPRKGMPNPASDAPRQEGRAVRRERGNSGRRSGADREARPTILWSRGKEIGRGMFGTVFLGLNWETGERCAVKSFANHNFDEERARLIRCEIEVMKDLEHRNIVQYFGSSIGPNNELDIFLEYVTGGSLSELLKTHGRLSAQFAAKVTAHITAGVEYLHSNGIIHRDIKSGNVLLTADGVAKLADFGCSKQLNSLDTTATLYNMRGSVLWMAPEMVMQTGHGFPADIWSLGCTVVEMSTAHAPWPQLKETLPALLFLSTTKTGPPTPASLNGTQYKAFIDACCVVAPEGRATAKQLLSHPFIADQITD